MTEPAKLCKHCDRPLAIGAGVHSDAHAASTELGPDAGQRAFSESRYRSEFCSEECLFCCGTRCKHLRALVADLRAQVADLEARLAPNPDRDAMSEARPCEHCYRLGPDGTYVLGCGSPECIRCKHVRALVADLRAQVADFESLLAPNSDREVVLTVEVERSDTGHSTIRVHGGPSLRDVFVHLSTDGLTQRFTPPMFTTPSGVFVRSPAIELHVTPEEPSVRLARKVLAEEKRKKGG